MRGYDYRTPGNYFFTVVTQDHRCVFGDVKDGVMAPNAAGRMVLSVWESLAAKFEGILTHAFVVMPNHCHGIVMIDRTISKASGPACLFLSTSIFGSVAFTIRYCAMKNL
jgi:REP element-mobilizing transposase RayT